MIVKLDDQTRNQLRLSVLKPTKRFAPLVYQKYKTKCKVQSYSYQEQEIAKQEVS